MSALGEFIELCSMAFAARGWDILKVHRAFWITRAEHAHMRFFLFRCKRITPMAFVAGNPMSLMSRSCPTVGLRANETSSRKPGMAKNAGINRFAFISRMRFRREHKHAAQEEDAKYDVIKLWH
jgi:hypothetical protein